MFHKYKKGFISLFLALAVMLSCCVLPVFATITEQRFSYYTTYTYTDEPILPRSYALGRGGDVLYETYNAMNYGSFTTADPIRITTVERDSTTNEITSIKMEFTNIDYWYIYVHNDGNFHINVHDTKETDYTTFYSADYYDISSSKTRFLKVDWSMFLVTCPDIKNGDTFTYYDLQKNLHTITFDGQGGIVGYTEVVDPDNPFGDVTEQEYPDFNLPEYTGKDISEYVDFETIIDSIQGLDVVGAVTGVLNALKGGFQYITHSVINIVSHLALTLVSLFDWLKSTLPILFGNMVVKLNPYFENLYNALKLIETAVKSNPVGEFVFDEEGLFGKLDEMLTTIKNFLTEQIFNALMVIPDIKTAIELWFTAIETSFSDTLTKLSNLYDSLVAFKDNALSSIQNIITDIKNLPNEISDKLTYLFIPSENYFENKMNSFKEFTLSTVFMEDIVSPVQNSISSAVNDRSAPAFSFEIFNSQCEMTFEPIAPVISMTDPIIIFVCYFFGLKHLLFSFLNLISTIRTERSNA